MVLETHLVDLAVKQLDGRMILVTNHGTIVKHEFSNIKRCPNGE